MYINLDQLEKLQRYGKVNISAGDADWVEVGEDPKGEYVLLEDVKKIINSTPDFNPLDHELMK